MDGDWPSVTERMYLFVMGTIATVNGVLAYFVGNRWLKILFSAGAGAFTGNFAYTLMTGTVEQTRGMTATSSICMLLSAVGAYVHTR